MRHEWIPITEQIPLIVLALLDDRVAFKQYEAENFTNALVINAVQSITGSVLSSLRIDFRYVPVRNRSAQARPVDYQLYIGYQKAGEAVSLVLVTLQALIDTEWVHHPIRNIPYLID